MTYLNKGQTYSLTVVDSRPPMQSGRLLRYRTFVRVSFEEEDQNSNPVASWQLWKEGRGLNEAYRRRGKLLGVEYVGPSQNGATSQAYCQIHLVKCSVDGFCVIWMVDPTKNVCGCAIPLTFHFLSTDFSRSKGVEGVSVRLCAKTELLRSEGEKGVMENDSEICCCVIKLFRDHGAERKLSNDEAHVMKKISRLHEQITDRKLGTKFDGKFSGYDPMNDEQCNHRHQKRPWSTNSRRGQTSDNDLHAELALCTELLSSPHRVSVLGLRGNERDDPDLYPVILPGRSNTLMETQVMNNQPLKRTHTTSASEGSVRWLKGRYVQLNHAEPLFCTQRPLEMRKVTISPLQGSSLSAKCASNAGSYHSEKMCFHNLLTLLQLHAFTSNLSMLDNCSRATIMQHT